MSLEALVSRMTELATLDPRRALTGASSHLWQGEGLADGELATLEAALGHQIPADFRRWALDLVGLGAGPFLGTLRPPALHDAGDIARPFAPEAAHAPGRIAGAMPVTRLPGDAEAVLVVSGPHGGSVWGDYRGAGGGLVALAPSFETFVDAWLTLAEVEWGVAYGAGDVPEEATELFGQRVRASTGAVLSALADEASGPLTELARRHGPTLAQVKHLHARFVLGDGDLVAAELAFADAGLVAPANSALVVLGRCAIAEARGDLDAWVAAAEDGLLLTGLDWRERKHLLAQRAHALEAKDRYPEALDAHIDLCEHDPSDLPEWLTVAYLMCHFGDFDRAVTWLRRILDLDTGLDPELSLREKMEQACASVHAALREEGYEEDSTSLEEAVERYLLTAELWG